jgi:hypothetical protein
MTHWKLIAVYEGGESFGPTVWGTEFDSRMAAEEASVFLRTAGFDTRVIRDDEYDDDDDEQAAERAVTEPT